MARLWFKHKQQINLNNRKENIRAILSFSKLIRNKPECTIPVTRLGTEDLDKRGGSGIQQQTRGYWKEKQNRKGERESVNRVEGN